jgi:ectoine hydroxylase-related dioxygenase (phytanoyl-CoA dioxygenase family)
MLKTKYGKVNVDKSIYCVNLKSPSWKSDLRQNIELYGFSLLENVMAVSDLKKLKQKMYEIRVPMQDDLEIVLSKNQLTSDNKDSGRNFVMRLMMLYDPYFALLLENSRFLEIIDSLLGDTSVLHLQNGFILPKKDFSGADSSEKKPVFHMDFPRILNGYLTSINIFMLISEFTEENGGTIVIPGSHQGKISAEMIDKSEKVTVEASEGSWLVFDSTLIHAAGENHSSTDRVAINHQITRSYFKQQIDYCSALASNLDDFPPRVKQLLGHSVRVPSSLEEFYLPEDKRFYKSNQG